MQQASQSFHYTDASGIDHFVPKGAVYDDDDPISAGRGDLFKPFATRTTEARPNAAKK